MLQKILEKKPYLAWYIRDKTSLSDKSSLEHILNYGDWEDVMEAEEILGLARMKRLFGELTRQKRVNLRAKTINYFEKYFSKYA